MNILFIYHRGIEAEDGGASRTIISRCNYLADNSECNIFMSFPVYGDLNSKITIESIDNFDPLAINRLIIKYDIDILDIPEGELLAEIGFKAVQGTSARIISEFHNMPGYELINILNSTKTSTKTGKLKLYLKFISYPFYRLYLKKLTRRRFQNACLCSDKLVVLSHSFIPEFKEKYDLNAVDNIVAIGNPLSFKCSLELCDVHSKKNILVVSRLSEKQKRISLILKAWKRIYKLYPDWSMNILGSGDSELYYKEYVIKNKIDNIYFYGQCPPEKFYENSAIFLMTSAYEGWGMVLTEALQKGCVPIVMNSFSALKEIVNQEEDGFIVANNDLDMFVDKIKYLIENDSRRAQMACAGILNSQRFTVDKVCNEWISLYNSVLNK